MIFIWVNKRDWRLPGPIVNMAVRNAHCLAALGHETHLFLGVGQSSNTAEDLEKFYQLPTLAQLHIHRIKRWNLGFSQLNAPIIRQAARLAKSLSKKDDVIVLTRETTFVPDLAKLCRHPRIRAFYEAHDLFADLSWRTDKISFKDWRYRRIEHQFLPRISGLICITQGQQKLYRHLMPALRSCALPLGTEPQPPADTEARRKLRTVVYVGQMHTAKGAAVLLKAAKKLAPAGVRTVFWGGSQKQIERFQARARKAGITDSVEFHGFRSPSELHQSLATEASIGVVALQDTYYNRHLTCPVKALDYLSHGLPIIGSEIECVREVCGDAASYIAPDDADSLARHALRLLDDPGAYAAAASASGNRAQVLSWENRARRLVDFAASTP